MKKLILILLAGLMLAAPVSGKILAVQCNGDATMNDAYTVGINNLWSHVVKVAGLPADSWDVIPLNAMNADSTAWLIETYGSSGDYDLIVFLNTPNWYGSNLTDVEILANGFGKFGKWIGPSDVTITTDMLVLLPDHAEATGSIFTDSLGVVADGARADSPEWSGCTYCGDFYNEDGDSIFMSTHEENANSYIAPVTNTHIHAPTWRSDSVNYPDSVRSLFWYSEKDAGSKVWIVPWAAGSQAYGIVLSVISMYEPTFTPIDMGVTVTLFGFMSDSTGASENFSDYMDWHEETGWKVTFCVSEYYSDSGKGTWINPFAARMYANPNFDLVIDGYTAFPFRSATNTTAQNLAAVQAGIDSIQADVHWSSIDTTMIWPYYGRYIGASGITGIINEVIPVVGMTDLIVRGRTNFAGWPGATQYGIQDADRIYTSGNSILRTHPIGGSNITADSLPWSTISYQTNLAAKLMTGAIRSVSTSNTLSLTYKHLNDATYGAQTAREGQYTGSSYIECAMFKDNASGPNLDAYKVRMGMRDYNALNASIWPKDWMDFHNHIAARYTKTGIVPFRNVFVRDVHYDRVLDRAYPNQHVKEGGYE